MLVLFIERCLLLSTVRHPFFSVRATVMRLLASTLSVTLVAGCGMSNQALRAEYPYRTVTQDDADDTITLAKLSSDAVVTTDYNLRYKLSVTAPAGDYVLRAKDSSGGRYFSPRASYKSIQLAYIGLTLLGTPKPDPVNGGIYVDPQGLSYVYWFWDTDTAAPVRVQAPGLSVAITVEIDEERVRARLERIEKERRAKAQQAAEEERKAAEAERRRAMLAALAAARSRDRVQCVGDQCERAFALAQAYLLKQADMRIQVATPTLIETYNATSDGQLQMRLLRVPTTGDRWEIVISAHCRDERKDSEERCTRKLIDAYSGFLPHMQGH